MWKTRFSTISTYVFTKKPVPRQYTFVMSQCGSHALLPVGLSLNAPICTFTIARHCFPLSANEGVSTEMGANFRFAEVVHNRNPQMCFLVCRMNIASIRSALKFKTLIWVIRRPDEHDQVVTFLRVKAG